MKLIAACRDAQAESFSVQRPKQGCIIRNPQTRKHKLHIFVVEQVEFLGPNRHFISGILVNYQPPGQQQNNPDETTGYVRQCWKPILGVPACCCIDMCDLYEQQACDTS